MQNLNFINALSHCRGNLRHRRVKFFAFLYAPLDEIDRRSRRFCCNIAQKIANSNSFRGRLIAETPHGVFGFV